jgi:hypothetical protein
MRTALSGFVFQGFSPQAGKGDRLCPPGVFCTRLRNIASGGGLKAFGPGNRPWPIPSNTLSFAHGSLLMIPHKQRLNHNDAGQRCHRHRFRKSPLNFNALGPMVCSQISRNTIIELRTGSWKTHG